MDAIRPIRLAMFDLDGTLFDTLRANFLAYHLAWGNEVPFDEAFFDANCMSRSYRDFLPVLGVPTERIEEIHERKKACYRDCFDAIRPNTSLLRLAALMKADGTTLAVVTTANRRNTEELLAYFHCRHLFSLLITQESVDRHKPAPDCYLTAMRECGASPAECVIFEDSDIGVEAGIAAGAAVYRVTFPARGQSQGGQP